MKLSDIAGKSGIFVDGDWIEKKDQDATGTVRLIQLADVGAGDFKDKSNRYITEDKSIELHCTYLKKGDILIARLGEPLCKACIFPYEGQYITAVDVAILRVGNDEVSPKYLVYLLNSPWFKAQVKRYESGTTRKRISRKNLERINIVFPSLPEQKRIVARIEELFSKLDNGVETLKKTKQQLAVYRQSVLKAAFESAVECSEKLMTIEDLLVSDRKGMATGPFGTLIKKHEHRHEGIPMLGIENIGEGKFIDGNKVFVTAEKAKELQSFALKAGDIIISRSGTVGEICSVPARMEGALLSTNLMRVSLNQKKVLPEYFIYMFQSKGIVLDQVKELCKGSTRIFLNQAILKQIHFPMPSIKTQSEILDEIESKMSVCDNIEKTVDATLRQTESLRQSILKKAFEGGL